MAREFRTSFEPTPYAQELFDAYYDVLTEGYVSYNADINSTSIETLKAILILFVTFPRKALNVRGKYEKLENSIKAIKKEEDFQKTCIEIFAALDELNLYIDLYKPTMVGDNMTNSKVVLLLKKISQNILSGYERTSIRLMFMFYLAFRHQLSDPIDDIFMTKQSIYEINRQVMSKADEVGLFMKPVLGISGAFTRD